MWKVILVSLVSAYLVISVSAGCLPSTTYTGAEVTYYGAYSGGGHCSLDGPMPPAALDSSIFATVAIADSIYKDGAACGMCVEITRKANDPGNGAVPLSAGSYIAFVNNQCPSCTANGIDLGLNGDGIWDVSWKPVACPVGNTKLQYKFQGSNLYYLKVQARNGRFPIQSFEVLQNGKYIPLVRQPDFFFLSLGTAVSYPVAFPLTVRITATTGDVVIDTISGLANDVIFQGTAQFPDCGSSSGSVASSSTSAKPTTTTTTTTTTTAKPTTTTTTSTTAKATSTTAKATSTTAKASTSTTRSATTGSVATTKAGGSTTGSSTGTFTNVFMNGFENKFEDWSWASGRNAAFASGFSGIAYLFAPKAFEALYFHCPGSTPKCIDSSKHSAVEFYYKSIVETKSVVSFAFVANDVGVGSKLLSSYVSATTEWVKVTVPISSGTYDGFWWQSNAIVTAAYVDSVRIVGK